MNHKVKFLLLAFLTGTLLSLAWPANGFPFLLLIAFIPLLYIENELFLNKKNHSRYELLIYAYIAFLTWNVLTTWWVYHASFVGALFAFILNSFFMAIAFWLFHISRRNIYASQFLNNNYGYLLLIVYWVAFEYFHMNWDLSWSWLNLGNGFATYYKSIQWYEYTGALGGTVWILLTNVLLFNLFRAFFKKNKRVIKLNAVFAFVVISLPLLISGYLYSSFSENGKAIEVLVIQPNIDPYNEKFNGLSAQEQIDRIISLTEEKITPNTVFIVAPETAIPEGVWLDELVYAPSVKRFKMLLENFPNASVVIGASTYKMYEEDEEKTVTARKYPNHSGSYDIFNSAIFIDTSMTVDYYHKSKLVPGAEKMPFPKIFGFLERFALDLGGMVGSHGIQNHRSVFTNNIGVKVAPVICYESIYGDFVADYVKEGAQAIFIITNDGWWENTPGYKQHNAYARLRAIETRRPIARSANTGISSFLNAKGDMFYETEWWEPDAIKMNITINDAKTFYTIYGDYIGRICFYLAILFLIYTFARVIINKKQGIYFF